MTIDVFLFSLTLFFALLKLLGIISWSWHWVFSPMYVFGIILTFTVAAALIYPDYFEALRQSEGMMK